MWCDGSKIKPIKFEMCLNCVHSVFAGIECVSQTLNSHKWNSSKKMKIGFYFVLEANKIKTVGRFRHHSNTHTHTIPHTFCPFHGQPKWFQVSKMTWRFPFILFHFISIHFILRAKSCARRPISNPLVEIQYYIWMFLCASHTICLFSCLCAIKYFIRHDDDL